MVGQRFLTRLLVFSSMLALSVLARVPDARAATPPALGGTFMFLGTSEPSIPEDKLPAYFAELQRAGMDTVIIQSTRTRKPAGCGNPYAWVPNMPDRIAVILDAAQARGFKVWVGLSMSDGCWDGAATTKAEARADTELAMRALYPRVGSHPAFAGIYLSDEPYLADNSQFAYFKSLADAVRAVANVPIAVSPYLYALTTSPPAALAARARDFRDATGIDLQIWQDSVGADATDVGWGRETPVADYYAALASTLGPGLWADLELFTAPLQNVFEPGTYRPAGITRLAQQMRAAAPAAKRVTWLAQYHMGGVDPHRYPEADRFYRGYLAMMGLEGEHFAPTSVTYDTAPSASYRDETGRELFDGFSADPKRYTHSGWVGVESTASMVLTLGSSRRVDWVSAHVLTDPAPYIYAPEYMTIECSNDNGASFAVAQTVHRPFGTTYHAGEYVLSQAQPLNATCTHLRVKLPSATWTFVSELELTADGATATAPTPPTKPVSGGNIETTTTPAPPPQPPPAPPVPNVLLVVSGNQLYGSLNAGAAHGSASVPRSAAAYYSVGFAATSALGPGDTCTLDEFGYDGVARPGIMHAGQTWTQRDDFVTGPPGSTTFFCAYCGGTRSGVYTQYVSCIDLHH